MVDIADGERWLPVGTHPNYEVSDLGRVRRARGGQGTRAGRVLAMSIQSSDYCQVALYLAGVATKRLVHRLVAEAFIGSCPIGMEVNHRDGDKRNNRLTNLEYCTSTENKQHAMAMGTRFGTRRNQGTHCRNGHEWTEANTHTAESGHRRCRSCGAARSRAYKERRNAVRL